MSDKIIYSTWHGVDVPFEAPEEVIWGLDFGFNNPTALVKVYIKDGAFCAEEKLYKTGLTNENLIDELKLIIPPKECGNVIYADSAESAQIRGNKQKHTSPRRFQRKTGRQEYLKRNNGR